MKTLKDFYDDTAVLWAQEWYGNNMFIPIFKEFFTYLKPNPRILDLGCGAGYESMRLFNLGAEVVGIDISEKSLQIAREKNPKVKFYNHDLLTDYSFLGKFDGVVSLGVILHIEEEKLALAFKNIANVLNKNGHALITIKDGDERRDFSEYNNEKYARNFISYTKEKLMKYAGISFKLLKNIPQTSIGGNLMF